MRVAAVEVELDLAEDLNLDAEVVHAFARGGERWTWPERVSPEVKRGRVSTAPPSVFTDAVRWRSPPVYVTSTVTALPSPKKLWREVGEGAGTGA